MKTFSIKLLLVLLIFNLASCKKENNASSFSNYQFTNKPQIINCSNADNKLLNEALYAFENDIANFYDKKQKTSIRGYNGYFRQASSTRPIDYTEFVSEHTVQVGKAINDLGIFNSGNLSHNNDLIKCIGENMAEGGLKTTFNALLSTNSMSKSLLQPALNGKASNMDKDKYLGLYVALEYFYPEINKVDFSQVDFDKRNAERAEEAKPITPLTPTNSKVDFNKRPKKQ